MIGSKIRRKIALFICPDFSHPQVDRVEPIAQRGQSDIGKIVCLSKMLASHRGVALSTLSVKVAGKGSFLRSLEDGENDPKFDVGIRRLAKIMQGLSDIWPDDLEWPADIERPAAAAADDEAA